MMPGTAYMDFTLFLFKRLNKIGNKMYNLSLLDKQILEVVSQKDFSTIWEVHAN